MVSAECADLQEIVAGDRDVMLSGPVGRESPVAACLPSGLVAQLREGIGEVVPREVSGDLHTAMSSSRTKWRRTIFGA